VGGCLLTHLLLRNENTKVASFDGIKSEHYISVSNKRIAARWKNMKVTDEKLRKETDPQKLTFIPNW